MHEISLMQRVLEIAEAEAGRDGASRIHRIGLRIGPLAGVVPEAFAFAFDVVTRGTMAEGAGLEVEYLPLEATCRACSQRFQPQELGLTCPACGSPQADLVGGRELDLTTLEVS